MEEFTIEALPEATFRTTYISPVELLALNTQINFDQFKQTTVLYTYALEHLETKCGDKWLPVKVRDKEVYMPVGIEKNYTALNQLITWFIANVVTRTFPESRE